MNSHLCCYRGILPAFGADFTGNFWEKIPSVKFCNTVDGTEPDQATFLKAAWDDEELRLIFHAIDKYPWATMLERDMPLYKEEVVEVFLDPVGDAESYFEIEVNPLNAVLDLVLRKNRSGYLKDVSWNCEDLKTRVAQVDDGWIAELSIPFASLVAETPVAGAKWRANFYRIDRPNGETGGVKRELTAFAPTGIASFHVPQKFATMEFVA